MVRPVMLGVLLLLVGGGVGACGGQSSKPVGSGPTTAAPASIAAVILDAAGRARVTVQLAGSIDRVTTDTGGGWYAAVAGNRGKSYTVVHLDDQGRPDPRWHATLGPHDPDDSFANLAAGDRLVYLAGNFGSIDGVARGSLGAVAAADGRIDPSWAASTSSVTGAVAIVVAGDRVIVAYGQRIAAFDARTGQPARGFRASTGPDNTEGPGVRTLAVSGRWVYVGGRFTKVDGVRRVGLARIDRVTGRLDPAWRPPAFDTRPCSGCDGDVMGLAISPTTIYVLGGFSAAGRSPAPGGLAALSEATGRPVASFRPPPPGRDAAGDSGSYTSAAVIGHRLFVGGDTRRLFVALDALTGRPVSAWHPRSPRASVSVLAASGAQLIVGGSRLGP